MRMDPPTAYIHPNSFDEVIVTKGPQTVTQGMGLVSGSVQFVRKNPDFTEKPYNINTSATVGSHGRRDGSLEAEFGGKYASSAPIFRTTKRTTIKTVPATTFIPTSSATAKCCKSASLRPKNTTIAGTYERSRAKVAYATV